MKKSQLIVSVIMILIVLILVFCIFLNKNHQEETLTTNNSKWQKTIEIYTSAKLYSTIEEEIILQDNQYKYTFNISYNDNKIEPLSISFEGKYETKKDYFLLNNDKAYIIEDLLCFNEASCQEPFSKNSPKYKHELYNFKYTNYLFNVSSISQNEGNSIYMITKNNCKSCQELNKIIPHIIYDFDIGINVINVDKLTKTEKSKLKEYNFNNYPLMIFIKDNKIVDKIDKDFTILSIEQALLKNRYNHR